MKSGAGKNRRTRPAQRLLPLLLGAVVLVCLIWQWLYIREEIRQAGAQGLQETYEQVNKTFTMFAQRNWNVLSEWGKNLEDDADGDEIQASLRLFDREQETWQYSDIYLFNEESRFVTAEGRTGTAEWAQTGFAELYRTGEATVSSYTASSGARKVVFAVPITPVGVNGVIYTSLAVSYDNETIEEMIGGRAYGGQSDCYIIYPDGGVMLSEDTKSEIEVRMSNLFRYLGENAKVDAQSFAQMQQDVAQGGSGTMEYRYGGVNYYLVYRPVGFQSLTIVGIVRQNVVNGWMINVQASTFRVFLILLVVTLGVVWWSLRLQNRLALEEKEMALRSEADERRKMESLANSDGLTGLLNERCFNSTLKEKEQRQEPFILFYLDLDRFKPVNDTYGHEMGDQLLKAVADRLRGCARNTDFAFRIGSDEFALIVNGEMDADWCTRRVEKIKSIVRQPYLLDGKTIDIGTSCGVARYPMESADVREIRILADQRMYEDKQKTGSGRGTALPV